MILELPVPTRQSRGARRLTFCSIPSVFVPGLDPGISLCSACFGGHRPAGQARGRNREALPKNLSPPSAVMPFLPIRPHRGRGCIRASGEGEIGEVGSVSRSRRFIGVFPEKVVATFSVRPQRAAQAKHDRIALPRHSCLVRQAGSGPMGSPSGGRNVTEASHRTPVVTAERRRGVCSGLASGQSPRSGGPWAAHKRPETYGRRAQPSPSGRHAKNPERMGR